MELQDLLEETLLDLERELATLQELATTHDDPSKGQLWRALASKVDRMKTKMQVGVPIRVTNLDK